MNPNATLIQDDFFKGTQSVELHRIIDIDGRRFRAVIDRDSYDNQCTAKAEVWTDAGWALVVSRPITAMRAVVVSAHARDFERFRHLFEADACNLIDAARDVVL